MMDLGWAELALVAILALIVVGPRDLPKLARGIGQLVGRVQRFYRESMFNLRRLEHEIALVDQPGGTDPLDLLPEHVRQSMAGRAAREAIDAAGEGRAADEGRAGT